MDTHSRRQPTQLRQAEIVLTLVNLAAERSPLEISTTDIAQAMGVSQATLFRHFPSKDAMRLAVAEWIESQLLARLDEAAAAHTDPLHALRSMFLAHVAFFAAYPGAPRFVFSELQLPDHTPAKERVRDLLHAYRARLDNLLSQGIAAGSVRPEVAISSAAGLFLGAIQGLVIQSMVSGDRSSLPAQAEAVFDLYLASLEARR